MNSFPNKNRLFWILQFSGWGLYWLYINTGLSYIGFQGPRYIIWNTFIITIGFFLTALVRLVYQRIDFKTISLARIFVIVIISSIITINVWYGLDLLVDAVMRRPGESTAPLTLAYYLQGVFFWGILIFAWNTLYFVIKSWIEWNDQRERTKIADDLAHKAQLQMLRYQLNPHFLFNSLNSIRALIDENEKHAGEMITELSEFLRYSLVDKNISNVPLRNEINALRHYFAIEKKRFEDKLNVLFNIDPSAEDFPVISFLLHPLVENAIKHGMRTSAMPLQIQIVARIMGNSLVMEVINSGKWIQTDQNDLSDHKGTGTGLSNIRQRLENAFPGQHSFDVIQKKNSVHFKIEITHRESFSEISAY